MLLHVLSCAEGMETPNVTVNPHSENIELKKKLAELETKFYDGLMELTMKHATEVRNLIDLLHKSNMKQEQQSTEIHHLRDLLKEKTTAHSGKLFFV